MSCMSDKERMADALVGQKYITGEYNTYVDEAGTPEVWNTLMNILTEEHHIQQEVWREMNSRGWYPTEKAEDGKISQEKMKFAPSCASCT